MLQTDKTDLRCPLKKGTLILVGAAVFILCLAFFCAFGISKSVTIDDGYGQTLTVQTMKYTVGALLDEQQINLNRGDVVTPAANTLLKNGQHITIQRAVAVTLRADGNQEVVYTVGETVWEVLQEQGVQLNEKDWCEPSYEQPVVAEMCITITRITEETVTVEETVPCQRVVRKNFNRPRGQDTVITQGKDGLARRDYLVTYADGEEIGREQIKEEMLEEPVAHEVEVGALEVVATSRGDVRARASYIMQATGYDVTSAGKSPSDPGYGITATGIRAVYGVVAVDPRVIPLGTRLYITSTDGSYVYGYATAADTGGAIKGNRIDLCFSSRNEALCFGRRDVKVYVLE